MDSSLNHYFDTRTVNHGASIWHYVHAAHDLVSVVGRQVVNGKLGPYVSIRQLRPPTGRTILSPPMGIVDRMDPSSDSMREAARIEAEEETGYGVLAITYLGSAYRSPGLTNEAIHTFAALFGANSIGQHLHDGEFIDVVLSDCFPGSLLEIEEGLDAAIVWYELRRTEAALNQLLIDCE